jgi:hypothetical protein
MLPEDNRQRLDRDAPVHTVVLDRNGDTWAVFFDPPNGDRCRTFTDKDTAWGAALALCADFACGFRDDADQTHGNRTGPRGKYKSAADHVSSEFYSTFKKDEGDDDDYQ